MTRNEAYALLPADALWSCSFGYPGEGGFKEFYRTRAGEEFHISNGAHDLPTFALDWQCSLQPAGYAAIRRGRPGEGTNCFAYGATLEECKRAARRQLQVPHNQAGCILYGNLTWDPLTAEQASECSSMLDAEWIF